MTVQSRLLLVMMFAGSGVGLLVQIFTVPILSQRLLAIAVFLMCIEQGRMAIVDLTNIHVVSNRPELANIDKLPYFHQITLSTIALELIGFYTSVQWLGWGCIIVLLSQFWFNALAGVQINSDADNPIQDFRLSDRAIVLLADGMATLPVILYTLNILPLAMAIFLFSMVCLYALVKYWPAIGATIRSQLST